MEFGIHKRITELRKQELKITQQVFADKLGIKRNTVAQYESGARMPGSPVISLICSKFNVNREWLENGTGEMFNQSVNQDEVSDTIDKLALENGWSEAQKEIASIWAKNPQVREAIELLVESYAKKEQ